MIFRFLQWLYRPDSEMLSGLFFYAKQAEIGDKYRRRSAEESEKSEFFVYRSQISAHKKQNAG